MAIPDYQSFMKPLLKFASDRQEHSIKEAYQLLADEFGLTKDERSVFLPSGSELVYKNRISWARVYLGKAGLLETTRRGYFKITDRGIEELGNHADEISTTYLRKYDEFVQFQATPKKDIKSKNSKFKEVNKPETPIEIIERAITEINEQLAEEILKNLSEISPSFFEKVVVELLVNMGYGGSMKEAGEVVGKSGDGGIDGIIKEDQLGLDVIYIQAKRWENVVSRPEIQKFVGALQGQNAQKGIFITTSRYSKEAIEYSKQIQNKIVLIDGKQIANLMIENEIGTTTTGIYSLKRLDSDYFIED